MKGIFQLPEGFLHAVEIPDIAGLHLTLRLSKLLQNALGHAGIGVPLLGAPLTLLLNELHQLRNGFAAELLCAAVGADLDLRDVVPQGLVLCRRLPQRLVLPTQGGQLLTLATGLFLGLAAGLLSEASAKAGPMLAACFIASRSLSAWALAAFPSARPNGMLDGFARTANRRLVTLSSGAYLLACAAVWLVCGGLAGLICIGAAAACTLYYRRMTDRLFGGVTGDLAGWFIQVTELALIAAVVLGGML